MSHEPAMKRSQVILRMPVDYRDVTLILEDGERTAVILFVPAGESIERHLTGLEPFLPVMRAARILLVARASIACASVAVGPPPAQPAEPEMPYEHQRAAVKLRGGTTLQGELRWPAVEGRQRTADHLNGPELHVLLYDADTIHYIAKAHVITVEEQDA